MLNLLITVVTTMLRTIPLIQILFILLISYSCLGVILFNDYRKGEALEHRSMIGAVVAIIVQNDMNNFFHEIQSCPPRYFFLYF